MAEKGLKVRIFGIEVIDKGKRRGEMIYAEVSLRKERLLFVFVGGDRSLLGWKRRERRGVAGRRSPERTISNKE
ncbi:hypothetical protein [Leptospirillum ferriphilum]|uniref:hypothetical protein n=1 Tax=Leptospirillum ferriphilum TaxID=178606 RepID=UPI00117A8111|nr:hypothetical protein [Leptospirillum ferriphilum]